MKELDLSTFVLVEDCLTGFLQAKKVSEELDLQLVFGLRMSLADGEGAPHKVIIFAKNDAGCKLLNRLYSDAFCEGGGVLSGGSLKDNWDEDALKLVVPFYDSFIFNNFMSYSNCVFEVNFTNPTFFIESNDLPFDSLVEERVLEYSQKKGHPTERVKSIYYKNREDFEAFQAYKCICGRSSYGRASTLSRPNLDHLGSREFCSESWAQKKDR